MKAYDAELLRLEMQGKLDSQKTQAERNALGQFATPSPLASDILAYAKQLMPQRERISFFDPAFGTGAFYSALLRTFPSKSIARARAYEIDPHYGLPALELWRHKSLQLHVEDFTRAMPPAADNEKSNLLICNPPYVRHHHLTRIEKVRLKAALGQGSGHTLSGLAGLYCYFLLLSHAWLADDGVAGWLIPSEFMDVRYGQQVKRYLLDDVTLLRVHRFEPTDMQFGDALVSSAVVWFRKASPTAEHAVEFTFGGSLLAPRQSKTISAQALKDISKWSTVPSSFVRTNISTSRLKLSNLFTIKRGLATGSNEFFILTEQQIKEHQIPEEFLTPILPSPRYVAENEIKADTTGTPLLRKQLYLLNCDLPEEDVKNKYPALWRYFEHGMAKGINERYLCRHRNPWYSQETRESSMFLCTYMGRQDSPGKKPFRFLLNHSRATVANTYLVLYPKPALLKAIQGRPERIKSVWSALDQILPETLMREGRVYGGGLHKMEPKELANAPADSIFAALDAFADTPEAAEPLTIMQMALPI